MRASPARAAWSDEGPSVPWRRPRGRGHYAAPIADHADTLALASDRVAATIDAALAAAPASDDPYRHARAAVEGLVAPAPGRPPPELLWSFWHDRVGLEPALDVVRALPGIPAGSTLERLLAGLAADDDRPTRAERAEAYLHAYGLRSDATLPPSPLRQARFGAALRTLVDAAAAFHRDDDDTTRSADARGVLHALADLQNLLNESVHPALERLTRAARRDMLLALYALARPELRPLLPIRRHVVLPEPWMGALDAVATLGRRPQVSAVYFADLGDLGERILLSVRFGGWPEVTDPERAADWARLWRAEIHGYRAARAIVA